MKKRIALLPVDGRPVTRELPKQIAAIGGWEILLPAQELVGFLKQPGNLFALKKWMEEVAEDVDGFVVSTDMLGYGGLVPSRVSTDSEAIIQDRMKLLDYLKQTFPHKPIMAFSATMRISNNYVNEEEKEYWSDYGVELWEYSYHSHRVEKTKCEDSYETVRMVKEKIPSHILQDYLQTRARNFSVSRRLLEKVEQGIIDVLVFPQDDTSEYGLNIKEQEILADEVNRRGLHQQVFLYPGADEVGNTLVSRMIYQLEGMEYPTFYPMYSGEKGALSSAMYEDRPLCESVKGQIDAFGSYTVSYSGEADIILAVNVPGKRQGDLALQKNLLEVDTADRTIGEWVKRIQHYQRQRKLVAIADTAYANGADAKVIPRLLRETCVSDWAGFAAWNTAGNTLGTVVAQAAMVYLQKKNPSLAERDVKERLQEQLLLRLLDDYVYQSIVRQTVRRSLNEVSVTDEELLHKVQEEFGKEAHAFLQTYGLDYWIKDIYLPWNRTFEIGIVGGVRE